MKVLGIDSSGLVASVAVVEDDILLAEYTVNYKKTHSQTLLPMLKDKSELKQPGCDRNRCRAGILYRSAYWFCHGKRSGAGT